jgi:amidase
MTDLCDQPAHDLVRAMHAADVSSREVVQAHLDRIARVNPSLNALVEASDPEVCLTQAAAADAAIAAGRSLGALHGLPVVFKDVVHVKGLMASGGSQALRAVATEDATVVARMRAEGAIVLGLTNVPEMGRGGESNNDVYGRTNNPYDLSRSPGGSSGGSAALIAAGGAPMSIGSDGGGSVRQPCHNNGIAGIKPTHGRIPRTGSTYGDPMGMFSPHVCYGPLARTVTDAALALAVVAGPDGRDLLAAPVPLDRPDSVDLSTLRVAFYLEDGISVPDQDTVDTVMAAVGALGGTVASVVEDAPACLDRVMELLWETVFLGGDRGVGFEQDLRDIGAPAPSEEMAEFLRQASLIELSVTEVRRRLVEIDTYRMSMLGFMDAYDVVLTPAMPAAAKPHHHGLNEIRDFSYLMAHNLTGWPAAVVRCGTSAEGLPLGVQIAARPWEDATALALAGHLEASLGGWSPPPLDAA